MIIHWIKASRLPAHMFIFPPLILGHALYAHAFGGLDALQVVLVHVAGLSLHLFIVYANDVADYWSDKQNDAPTAFTGGSRVLIEERLTRRALFSGAIVMAFVTIALASLLSFRIGSAWPIIFAVSGILLLQAYSFSPIKLSYRGFGESLQMVGVGIVLPLFAFFSQGGVFATLPWAPVLVLLPAQLALAVSTALPDAPADRRTGKRTSVVLFGVRSAGWLVVGLLGVSLIVLNVVLPVPITVNALIIAVVLSVVLLRSSSLFRHRLVTFVGTAIVAVTVQVLAASWVLWQMPA